MADNWFQLIIKWLFVIIGIPTIAEIFFQVAIQHTFETATTFYQIIIGFALIICFFVYVYFGIIKLFEESREFFG